MSSPVVVLLKKEPNAANFGDFVVEKSGRHSRGGRLSAALTEPVNDLEREILLVCDRGLESSVKGVRGVCERTDDERNGVCALPVSLGKPSAGGSQGVEPARAQSLLPIATGWATCAIGGGIMGKAGPGWAGIIIGVNVVPCCAHPLLSNPPHP